MPNEKPIPQQIPIEKIHDLPGIPIVKLPDKSYGGLVTSMLLDGMKEPVILRQREDGEYQLVSGFRRRKAAELAKLKELPALVYDMTEKEAMAYCEKRNAENPPPIPGKLIDPAAKTPASAKEPPKAEKAAPAEKKAEAKQPAKASQPQEKKAESAEKKAEAEKPTDAPAEKKTAEPPKSEKKTEAHKTEPAPEANAADQKEKKAVEAPAPAAADKEKKPAPAKAPAKKAEKEEKPVGTAAVGPTGTLITKLLGEKLNPPTAKDKKDLPVPGEGEAFAVTLHPAYLKKADINTFSVDRNSDDFKELFQSIKRFGVKDPVLARFGKDGELEIISGQRRHLIATELNYPVPTIIQQLDDDDARILVADGNLHREHISTYDLSRAVKMKSESMKRKVGRRSKFDTGPKKQYTDEAIAAEMGMSTAKLNRLMKLSEATKQICDLVDDNTIPLSVAYNIAFLIPKYQDTVADLIGINVKVNNENTQLLKKVAEKESLTEKKIRDVLEGNYPPKVVEKPKPVTPPVPAAPAAPSMAPTSVPKSPDIPAPPATPSVPAQPTGTVVPFPAVNTAPAQNTEPAAPGQNAMPVAPMQAAPAAPEKPESGAQDRENSYETKIVLRGDRLRKYFPDVSMTPREIEDSIYDALEMRRQMQEKAKQKAEIFGKEKKGPVK
jgi:ParB-like chromosome segregation protein Spo0J